MTKQLRSVGSWVVPSELSGEILKQSNSPTPITHSFSSHPADHIRFQQDWPASLNLPRQCGTSCRWRYSMMLLSTNCQTSKTDRRFCRPNQASPYRLGKPS